MDHSALIKELASFLREDQLLTSDEDLSVYAFDGTAMLHNRPACVVLPERRKLRKFWPCAIKRLCRWWRAVQVRV